MFHLAAGYRLDLSDAPALMLARQKTMRSAGRDGALRLPLRDDVSFLPEASPVEVRQLLLVQCSCIMAATKRTCHAAPQGDRILYRPGFYDSELHDNLAAFGVTHLLICGLNTSVGHPSVPDAAATVDTSSADFGPSQGVVETTVREAVDRGYTCCAVEDALSPKDDCIRLVQWMQLSGCGSSCLAAGI